MRETALVAAGRHTWYEAMEQMVYGYQEVLARHPQEILVA